MKRRKLIALLMAGTLLMGGTLPAQAATGTAQSASPTTVTGSGNVGYIDTTIYNVGLPTTSSLTLTVDPQGLQGLEKGKSASAEALKDYAGKVTCGSIAPIVNLGSVPAKVTVSLALTGDAKAVTTKEAVEADTANNILLYAVPAAADYYDDPAAGEGTESAYAGSTTGIVMGESAVTVDFVLPEAEYEFKKSAEGVVTYEKVTGKNPHGTGLKFEGLVNSKADWADYIKAESPSTIGMTAAFTFTHTLADGDKADTTEGAPAFMAKNDDLVTVEVEGSSSNGGAQQTDDYVMTKGNDGSISYTFVGEVTGTLTAVAVNGEARNGQISKGNISLSGKVLTFNAAGVSACGMDVKTSDTVVVTIGSQEYTLTYTK